jgi:acetate kinase
MLAASGNVFAGGIGEKAPVVRFPVCAGLGCLGVELEEGRNGSSDAVISAATSRVRIRVIHTDQERMIAKYVSVVLGLQRPVEKTP